MYMRTSIISTQLLVTAVLRSVWVETCGIVQLKRVWFFRRGPCRGAGARARANEA